MHDCANLKFAQRTFQQCLVAQIAADDCNLIDHSALVKFRMRRPVTDQADDIGLGLEQSPNQPAADQSRRAGDEDASISPESFVKTVAAMHHESFRLRRLGV